MFWLLSNTYQIGILSLQAEEPLHTLEYAEKSYWLRFSPDSKTLLVTNHDKDNSLKLWDVETGKLLAHLKYRERDNYMGSGEFTSDGKLIIGSTREHLHVWDAVSYKHLRQIPLHQGATGRFALSPDGKIAAVVAPNLAAILYDTETGRIQGEIVGDGRVQTIQFSPDGKWLVVNAQDRVVIWDVATRKELKFLSHEQIKVEYIRFSPDGKSIFAVDERLQMIVWNPEDRTQRAAIKLAKAIRSIQDFAIAPDGKPL